MPEPKAPQTIAEQYDIGALVEAPEPIETPAPDDRARRPDGTFLPKETAHTHPSYQARRAKDLGMSDAEIAETSPEVLDHIIYQATEQWRLNATQRDFERRPQEAPQVAPEEPVSAIDDEASIHPGLLKLLKDQQKTIAEMQKQLESVRNEGRARHLETLEEKVDRVFDESPELFGTGRGRDMDKESAEFAKRLACINLADKMKTGSTEQKLRQAKAKLFGAAAPATKPKPAEPALTPAQAAWNEAAVHAPTARKSSLDAMPNGRDKAIRAVRADMQGSAVNGEASETTLDEFPG